RLEQPVLRRRDARRQRQLDERIVEFVSAVALENVFSGEREREAERPAAQPRVQALELAVGERRAQRTGGGAQLVEIDPQIVLVDRQRGDAVRHPARDRQRVGAPGGENPADARLRAVDEPRDERRRAPSAWWRSSRTTVPWNAARWSSAQASAAASSPPVRRAAGIATVDAIAGSRSANASLSPRRNSAG